MAEKKLLKFYDILNHPPIDLKVTRGTDYYDRYSNEVEHAVPPLPSHWNLKAYHVVVGERYQTYNYLRAHGIDVRPRHHHPQIMEVSHPLDVIGTSPMYVPYPFIQIHLLHDWEVSLGREVKQRIETGWYTQAIHSHVVNCIPVNIRTGFPAILDGGMDFGELQAKEYLQRKMDAYLERNILSLSDRHQRVDFHFDKHGNIIKGQTG